MRILLLAPHPFYQERGTPIAVNQILRVLATRGDAVDVLTFHEGQDLHYKNVSVFSHSLAVFCSWDPAWIFVEKIGL